MIPKQSNPIPQKPNTIVTPLCEKNHSQSVTFDNKQKSLLSVIYKQHCANQEKFLILLIAVSSFGESLRWELPHRPSGDLYLRQKEQIPMLTHLIKASHKATSR